MSKDFAFAPFSAQDSDDPAVRGRSLVDNLVAKESASAPKQGPDPVRKERINTRGVSSKDPATRGKALIGNMLLKDKRGG